MKTNPTLISCHTSLPATLVIVTPDGKAHLIEITQATGKKRPCLTSRKAAPYPFIKRSKDRFSPDAFREDLLK